MSAAEAALRALLEVMGRLRDPRAGCRWDLAQDFRSIAPYTIEEAYEVADAIERDDRQGLRDELGDLLFQVVFHARMAQERAWFDFADVAGSIPRQARAPPPARVQRESAATRRAGSGDALGRAEGARARCG
jgi:ATP diphosphatase